MHLWQERVRQCLSLTDSEGGLVEVLYPGRWNDGRGGDFRDALVVSGEECLQGNIEVHTRTGGWAAHGHHRDPAYNQVVLHVAFQEDRRGKTQRQDGRLVPTVILGRQPSAKVPLIASRPGLPCLGIGNRRSPAIIIGILEIAGDARLQSRRNIFQDELKKAEPGQCLYQGISEALGYTKNKLPFRELASRVPLVRVQEIFHEKRPESERLLRLQACLLGASGLLPSQHHLNCDRQGYLAKLEDCWQVFQPTTAMSVHDWELYRVRPVNFPVRRIVALSYLIWRYRKKGWLQSLIELVRNTPEEHFARELESAFTVAAGEYWDNRYDFGTGTTLEGQLLLGRERAAEIIINVLLPFTLAWAQHLNDEPLARKSSELYINYPRREGNSIERHMLQQLAVAPSLVNSARLQQGLLHLYKMYCIKGRCDECDIVLANPDNHSSNLK